MRHGYKTLVGKPKGKRPLGRPRHKWEDTIKFDLKGIGVADVDWIQLAVDSVQYQNLVNTAIKIRVS
jgi:hypothetical protein